MFSKRIAIDLGTANVLVYLPKRGIVINEPSVVAVDDTNRIIPIASAAGNMVVDIGGGTTEIAILSLGGVVAQHSIRVGGNRFDAAIADYIRRTYGLAVGDRTAEIIKQQLGTALMLTRDKTMEIRGRDIVAGLPKTISIRANEITGALTDELEKVIQAIRVVLEQTPPELSSDIIDRGMVLTGGGALLQNLDKMLTQVTGVPCVVAEEPLLCVARGTGIALDNLEEYKRSLVAVK
jgi:rod shape-determining protein MreB